jgi:hypothetical protein
MTPAVSNGRLSARPAIVWIAVLAIPVTAACGAFAAKPTACNGLVYKEGGLTRAEYLPCAGEMMATLDRLAPQIEKMLDGDASARSDASASVRELRTLLKQAGGRNILERWDDRALTSLNLNISNTLHHHEACMMVAGQMFGPPPLGDEKYREAARSQCRAYRPSYADATRAYGRVR